MIDMADDSNGEGLNFGIPLIAGPFERLSQAEKYTVLEQVTRALLFPTPACPPLNAINESAVYYVFAWLKDQFDDVESGEEVWGEQVLVALHGGEAEAAEAEAAEAEDPEGGEGIYPTMGCMDGEKWDTAVDSVADSILWDRDWEMEADLGFGAAQGLMQRARIDPDYFDPYSGGTSRGAKQRLYSMVRAVSDQDRGSG